MRNLKSPFFAIILLFGVLLLVGVPLLTRGNLLPQPAVDDSRFVEYRNPNLGFRVMRPEPWQVAEDRREVLGTETPTSLHAVTFVPGQDSKTLVVVFVQTLTTTETLESFANRQVDSIQAVFDNDQSTPALAFAKPSLVTVNGRDAIATEATFEKDGSKLKARLIMLLDNLRGYALVYIGPDQGRFPERYQSMVDSFDLVK